MLKLTIGRNISAKNEYRCESKWQTIVMRESCLGMHFKVIKIKLMSFYQTHPHFRESQSLKL